MRHIAFWLAALPLSLLNIARDMHRLEVGNIWYGTAYQRTRANTEAVYLLLSVAFDVLGYRRVEWKCDALNAGPPVNSIRPPTDCTASSSSPRAPVIPWSGCTVLLKLESLRRTTYPFWQVATKL